MVSVGYGDGYAYCIKEAGDDPDVTNGIEVRVSLTPNPSPIDEGELSLKAVKVWDVFPSLVSTIPQVNQLSIKVPVR